MSRYAVIGALVAAAVSTAGTAARATPPPQPPPLAGSPVAAGLGAAATLAASLSLMTILFKDVRDNARVAMGIFYTGAALGLGLGGAAVGIQATHPGRCDSTCDVAHALGGVGIGVGALDGILGIVASVEAPRGPRWASLTPVPLLIATERGRALGVGLAGVMF